MLKVLDLEFEVLIDRKALHERIESISAALDFSYEGKKPVFIGILNGSFMFLSEIFKILKIDCEVSFVKVSSYQNQTSTETITELIGLGQSIENKDIIIVEDIIDTGFTVNNIIETLKKENPKSIKIMTLLLKPKALKFPVKVDYVGFEVENKFVMGFGMDYNGFGRNTDAIYVKTENLK